MRQQTQGLTAGLVVIAALTACSSQSGSDIAASTSSTSLVLTSPPSHFDDGRLMVTPGIIELSCVNGSGDVDPGLQSADVEREDRDQATGGYRVTWNLASSLADREYELGVVASSQDRSISRTLRYGFTPDMPATATVQLTPDSDPQPVASTPELVADTTISALVPPELTSGIGETTFWTFDLAVDGVATDLCPRP